MRTVPHSLVYVVLTDPSSTWWWRASALCPTSAGTIHDSMHSTSQGRAPRTRSTGNMHSLKTENYVLFDRQNWALQVWESSTRALAQGLLQELRRSQDTWGVLQQRPSSQKIKTVLLNTESRHLKFMNIALFMYRQMQDSGLAEMRSFDMHLSYLAI